jgi:hypothetical protein
LASPFVGWETTSVLDDLPQLYVHAFDGISGLDDFPYLGRTREDGNHLLPLPLLHRRNRRGVLHSIDLDKRA